MHFTDTAHLNKSKQTTEWTFNWYVKYVATEQGWQAKHLHIAYPWDYFLKLNLLIYSALIFDTVDKEEIHDFFEILNKCVTTCSL